MVWLGIEWVRSRVGRIDSGGIGGIGGYGRGSPRSVSDLEEEEDGEARWPETVAVIVFGCWTGLMAAIPGGLLALCVFVCVSAYMDM